MILRQYLQSLDRLLPTLDESALAELGEGSAALSEQSLRMLCRPPPRALVQNAASGSTRPTPSLPADTGQFGSLRASEQVLQNSSDTNENEDHRNQNTQRDSGSVAFALAMADMAAMLPPDERNELSQAFPHAAASPAPCATVPAAAEVPGAPLHTNGWYQQVEDVIKVIEFLRATDTTPEAEWHRPALGKIQLLLSELQRPSPAANPIPHTSLEAHSGNQQPSPNHSLQSVVSVESPPRSTMERHINQDFRRLEEELEHERAAGILQERVPEWVPPCPEGRQMLPADATIMADEIAAHHSLPASPSSSVCPATLAPESGNPQHEHSLLRSPLQAPSTPRSSRRASNYFGKALQASPRRQPSVIRANAQPRERVLTVPASTMKLYARQYFQRLDDEQMRRNSSIVFNVVCLAGDNEIGPPIPISCAIEVAKEGGMDLVEILRGQDMSICKIFSWSMPGNELFIACRRDLRPNGDVIVCLCYNLTSS
eukprot:NODE_159_length_2953_cov_27.151171_g146_i0.p1 GENE.NODE_159_length_2953_cov_27.151171_g146_i0~~NODE_159_length_2953_cov_27.151171_g146_i0.p1  ORF type:complete len:486 (+),score=71.50 NODE_159_length_2953_cov_27.151171_g146_i0:1481-2938(+)